MKIEKLYESVIWTNPMPVLRSRHSCFPFACELEDGRLLASHVIEEAFESVDGTTRLSVSHDRGRSWELLPEVYDKSDFAVPTTDSMKITNLGDGKLVLFGYEYFRENPDYPIGNPENGGLLDDRLLLLRSSDSGKSWLKPEEVPCRWGHHVEASAPLLVLKNGDWVTPITEFVHWDGTYSESMCGRLLRSTDQGKTWDDDTVALSLGDSVTVFEQRVCQLDPSGDLVVISWNEDWKTGERFNNHYAISKDNGKTFSGPFDTGVKGQAASVCALPGNRLLALHAVRRDTDRPGVYAFVVNLENGKWEIESQDIVWEPDKPIVKDTSMAEVFSFLKFGQPGAIRLKDGTILMTHWAIENGQGRTIATAFSCDGKGTAFSCVTGSVTGKDTETVKTSELKALSGVYLKELAGCLDFWRKYGLDREYRGLLSCLDREGKVYGNDKAVWIQGRSAYTFSKYYNEFDRSEKWLGAAKSCYDFLLDNCFDEDGRMFFIVTRDGRPVQKRRYYFSETFAVVAGAEYYKSSGEIRALENAREVFDRILHLYHHPETLPQKYNPEVVQAKALAIPMILTTTTQTLREADPENTGKYDACSDRFIGEILTDFLKPEKKALLETVGLDGGYLDSPAGRTVNPGHAIEASWFLIKEGRERGDETLVKKAIDILDWSFDLGWDKEYGGLLSFIDIDGRPPEKLEWDMKLWWPHVEALISFLMAYKYTGDQAYFDKFRLVHDYTFGHFRDKEYGEWYGYLHRDGTVANDLKGNIFKGPFHIPRALMICHSLLNEYIEIRDCLGKNSS